MLLSSMFIFYLFSNAANAQNIQIPVTQEQTV